MEKALAPMYPRVFCELSVVIGERDFFVTLAA